MPIIPVSFNIDLTDDDAEAVAEAIGCAKADLGQRLPAFAHAALLEYTTMMTGEAAPNSMTDLRVHRLILLITKALGGRIPDEARLARIFSITSATVRTTFRSALARHRRKLDAAVKTETAAFLAACVRAPNGDDWKVTWLNSVLIEQLNVRLQNANALKEPIKRNASVLGGYIVPNGSYQWLLAHP